MKNLVSAMALLAIIVWCVAAAAPRALAHEPSSAAKQSADVLTDDGLKTMLDNMGLEPKPLSKGFLIAIKRDTWTYNIQLRLSSDGTKIGFNSNLGKVDDPDTVTADQWKNLLISNGDIDPSFFFFDKDQKKLYLHRVLDNHALTPAYLRTQIDNFCGNIKNTADLWKFTK